MVNEGITVGRFRLFYFYSIDIGHLIKNTDIDHLLELRARDGIYGLLCDIFKDNVSAGPFSAPSLETNQVESRAKDATKRGGKDIWSPLFYKKQAPLNFSSNNNVFLSPGKNTSKGTIISFSDGARRKNSDVYFSGCEFRIFREAILSFRFEFKIDNCEFSINVSDFINHLRYLEEETFSGYMYWLKEVIQDFSKKDHLFSKTKLSFLDYENEMDIKTSTIRHSCLFLEKINGRTLDVTPLSYESIGSHEKKVVAGILNKSTWYDRYGSIYVDSVFKKNIGYREDEIYITDKDSSLIVLADYWDSKLPLQYYMIDLMLATEMQIAKLAHLDFILKNLQANSSYKEAWLNPAGEKAIQLITQTKSILTLALEAADIDSLIVHGFSRRFIKQIIKERDLQGYLDAIERRVGNISSAVELQSTLDVGKKGNLINKIAVIIAIIALALAFTNQFNQLLCWFVEIKP